MRRTISWNSWIFRAEFIILSRAIILLLIYQHLSIIHGARWSTHISSLDSYKTALLTNLSIVQFTVLTVFCGDWLSTDQIIAWLYVLPHYFTFPSSSCLTQHAAYHATAKSITHIHICAKVSSQVYVGEEHFLHLVKHFPTSTDSHCASAIPFLTGTSAVFFITSAVQTNRPIVWIGPKDNSLTHWRITDHFRVQPIS